MGHYAGDDLRVLRGQGELVGVLRAVGFSPLWAYECPHHEWRSGQVGRRGADADAAEAVVSDLDVPVPARRLDDEIRAFADDALAQSKAGKPLIDVRSPGEYKGTVTHMPEYPQEGVLRGGHIPGAKSVPWKTAVNEDGTFRSLAELTQIYTQHCGLLKDQDIIAYCRIGERSSHTWFVLTYLLGYPNVRNYDGSWTEWGNRVRMPIERSA